jgi:peptide/nickel transport system substrate-binding protein
VVLVRDIIAFNVRAGRYLVSVLDSLGYRARLKTFPPEAQDRATAAVTSGRFQSGINGWIADYPAPSDFIDVWFSCRSPLRSLEARFCDPDVQKLIDLAVQTQTYDPASAPDLWASADRAIVDAAPWVPLLTPLSVNFVSKRVGNYQDSQPYSGVLLDQLWVR